MLLGLDLLAAHMVGDYILQNDWMAKNKRKYFGVLVFHSVVYALSFGLLAQFYTNDPVKRALFFVGIIFAHVLVDKVDWQMGNPWPPKGILVDQTIHIVVLAILARILL